MMERESTPEAGISKPQGREGARMESVLLAVALLGFGIGGYFVAVSYTHLRAHET